MEKKIEASKFRGQVTYYSYYYWSTSSATILSEFDEDVATTISRLNNIYYTGRGILTVHETLVTRSEVVPFQA